MKCSDYIVEFLADKGITDVFGYPGGMVTHLMDSFRKYSGRIHSHVCYHEQAASFAACGYAQASGRAGMAYATSGPGALNMMNGICNAWFDSIPAIFISGQVNTNESSRDCDIRQIGFQETDIVSIVEPVTKYAVYVSSPETLPEHLNTAYTLAATGRKGPVLLDIPMNVMRSDTQDFTPSQSPKHSHENSNNFPEVLDILKKSSRPCILFGAGIKDSEGIDLARKLSEKLKLPCISSMIASDILPYDSKYRFGFIGAYGSRTANFTVAKSDLILSLGSRLDIRQTGAQREKFAEGARIIRVDIDPDELSYNVHDDDVNINADAGSLMHYLMNSDIVPQWHEWLAVCEEIRERLSGMDEQPGNIFMSRLSGYIPDDRIITADVGQNQVWTAQSFRNKPKQKVLYSGGFGSMGYSLPASIGAFYASGRPVVSLNGDGGFQMNMQELQFIAREHLPIKIIVFNNHALGMLRHFQEMYFDRRYIHTTKESGYTVPDLGEIAGAFGLDYYFYDDYEALDGAFMADEKPALIEIAMDGETVITPKARFGSPAQDQEPLLDRSLYDYIMNLGKIRNITDGGGGHNL